MNADQLWETTLDPSTRKLVQVTVDDVQKVDDTFKIQMGSNAELRKDFISKFKISLDELDG